ncbi:uncharacterized protein LOC113281315 [Papaver somniferum]|uniref:uncharacterized protein LOC113281315 n=1 Tax=Papaver somniferum TaxID=3469 RepID=UPI000E701F2B|nr:uncharacterized protein LOC113281315 [Papaver somniferum]
MDYHSLTRKELQFLCKKNKIRANMTNFAMADTLSSLPKVHGVEGNRNFTPETPTLTSTSRKSKATATKPLSYLDNSEPMSSNGDLARHTLSPLTNLYPSDINIPKEVHVVDHPHGTRLAKRLKLSAQKVGGRNDAINIEMLPGEDKNEEMRTKYEVNDDVLPYNEGNRIKVSNEEQDEVGTGDVSYIMVCAESLKLEEFTVHLNGDQDAIIEETSSTSIMGGVSGDKTGCSLSGCSSEVSYAPRVSAKKSLNITRTLVGCTSDISSAPMVSKPVKVVCDLNETYLMGEETMNIKDPNEDQNMESKDEPIQVNEPSLTVEKTEIFEASNLDDQKSKLMCDIELCNVKVTEAERENISNGNDDISDAAEKLSFSPSVTGLTANQIPVYVATPTRTTTSDDKVQETTPLISHTTSIMGGVPRDKIGCSLNGCSSKVSYAPRVSAKKSLNTARTLVGCTSDIFSAPMLSKSVKVVCDLNETYLMSEETINIKDSNEDEDMESKDQPGRVNEPSLTVEKAEILEASNHDDEKSKLMCDIELCNVKVTEVEAKNSSSGNDDISDAAEKLSFSPSATGLTANQIPVYVATPTRTTTLDDKVQGTTPLISYTKKKEVTIPIISAGKSMNIARACVGCTSELSSAPTISAEKSMNNALVRCKTSLVGEETENIKVPNEQNMEIMDQPIEINEVVGFKSAHNLEVKFINEDELSNLKGTEVETKYVDESFLMVKKAENLEDSNVDDGKIKFTCEVGFCGVKVTEIEEDSEEDGPNVNNDISDVLEKFSLSPSATGPVVNPIPVHVASPTRATASENQVQETTPLNSFITKKAVTTPKGSIEVLDDMRGINERGKCSASTSKVVTELEAELKHSKGENSSQGKLNSTSIRQLKRMIKLTHSENKNATVDQNKEIRPEEHENEGQNTLQRKVGFCDVKVTEVEEDSEEVGFNVNNDISDVLEKFSLSPSATGPVVNPIPVHVANPTRATASEDQVQETTPLISFITKKAVTTPKGSIKVSGDMRGINERGKCRASTSKVVTEFEAELKHSKGENSSQGKLNFTSIRQLKKMIKLTHPENKNAIVDQNKEIRPEEHENKGQNTLQRKLKATSLRQLKKTVKQLIQSDNENINVKLNKKVVPEDNEDKDQNTAERELKATSARQLIKMIKQRTQTTKTPLPSLILAE